MRVLAVAARDSRRRFALLACVIGVVMAAGAMPALAVPFPVVTIGAPSSVSYTTAHVSGTVNPEGSETFYQFQYSVEPEFLGWTPAGELRSAGEGSSAVEVEEDLVGLAPNTPYQVRLVSYNFGEGFEVATEAPYPTFTTLEVPAPTISIAAPSAITGTGASFSGEINPGAPGGNPAAFDVEWHFECTPECPGLTGGTIPADAENHTVESAATGLLPGIKYEVSLITSNAAGQTTAGPQSFSTPAVEPQILETSAHAQINEATLQAQVNPGGAETAYHFEYGPTSAYGHSTPVKTIPAGNSTVKVTAVILGLSPASSYHYRIVASNSAGSVEGPDKALTTASAGPVADTCPNAAIRAQQDTSALPECRAMELVSQPGNDLGDVVRVLTGSDDGEHVAFLSPIAPEGALGVQFGYAAVASRSGSGWSSADANLPMSDGDTGSPGIGWMGFSDDLSRFVLRTNFTPDPGGNGGSEYYRLAVGTGASTWLTKVHPYVTNYFQYVGGSSDLSRAVYSVQDGGSQYGKIYAVGPVGEPELVNVDPGGKELSSAQQSQQVVFHHGRAHGRNGVSSDGTKVFFNAVGLVTSTPGSLYRRDTATGTTIEVSTSQRTGEVGADGKGIFIGATPDGETVYFQSDGQLTDAASEGGGIYRFDVEAKELTLVAADPNENGEAAAEQLYEVNKFNDAHALLSDDGSRIYFKSFQALAPGAHAGEPNIYVESGGTTRLVAAGVNGLTRVSPNGRYALVVTSASIDGAPNNGRQAVYEYDDESGQVVCASCRPDGSPSEGDAGLEALPFATINGEEHKNRNIADNGAVFFDSNDRLVPADHTTANDVYEYRAGTLSMLSSGKGDSGSWLADNSDDGKNVFIMTRAVYDPRDQDPSEIDLYDARVDGGFPYPEETVPVKCSGDACQEPPTSPPVLSGLGSVGLQGRGNVKATSVKVAKPKTVRGAKVTLSIQVPSDGKLTISGARLKSVSKSVVKAGSYGVRVTLTAAARASLKRRHSFTVVAKVLFTASDGSQGSATVKLLFKSASKGSR